jgi:hypothetical protein
MISGGEKRMLYCVAVKILQYQGSPEKGLDGSLLELRGGD